MYAKAILLWVIISVYPLFVSGNEISALCFPPHDTHCMPDYLNYIQNSEESIFMAVYAFASLDIANALKVNTHSAKYIIIDKYTAQSIWGKRVLNILRQCEKITVYEMSKSDALMHSKFTVVDRIFTQTGSINYSNNGFNHNYENMIFIDSEDVAQQYIDNFKSIVNDGATIIIKN